LHNQGEFPALIVQKSNDLPEKDIVLNYALFKQIWTDVSSKDLIDCQLFRLVYETESIECTLQEFNFHEKQKAVIFC